MLNQRQLSASYPVAIFMIAVAAEMAVQTTPETNSRVLFFNPHPDFKKLLMTMSEDPCRNERGYSLSSHLNCDLRKEIGEESGLRDQARIQINAPGSYPSLMQEERLPQIYLNRLH